MHASELHVVHTSHQRNGVRVTMPYPAAARRVAMGFDEGAVMIKIGREEPVASMDVAGKIIWARHNDIQTVNIKALGADAEEVLSWKIL